MKKVIRIICNVFIAIYCISIIMMCTGTLDIEKWYLVTTILMLIGVSGVTISGIIGRKKE